MDLLIPSGTEKNTLERKHSSFRGTRKEKRKVAVCSIADVLMEASKIKGLKEQQGRKKDPKTVLFH